MKKITGTLLLTAVLAGHVAARFFMGNAFTFTKSDYEQLDPSLPSATDNKADQNPISAPVLTTSLSSTFTGISEDGLHL